MFKILTLKINNRKDPGFLIKSSRQSTCPAHIYIESESLIMNTISLRSEEERVKNDIIRDLRSSMTIPSNRNGSMDSEDDGDLTASTSFVPVDLERAQANLLLDRAINLSWVVNFLLLLAKIYVGVVSNSKSMWASLADSFVDLLSQVVLSLAAKYSRKHNPEYPVGRSRLEALSVLACAFIMIIASIQVVQYSISDLVSGFNGNIPVLDLETIMIVIIILGIVAKLALHIYCRFANNASNSDALAALAEDHLNDVMSNSVALATASIAVRSTGGWWVDPVGAIVISIAIIYRWIFVMRYINMSRLKLGPFDTYHWLSNQHVYLHSHSASKFEKSWDILHLQILL